MPTPPKHSLCEALHGGDVADLLVRAMELAPDRHEDLAAIARNDQLSVEFRVDILTGTVCSLQENMTRQMERERGRAYRREVLTNAAVWIGQASMGGVSPASMFRPFIRRQPGV